MQKAIELLNKEFPQDTEIQNQHIPLLRSLIDPAKAVEDLEPAQEFNNLGVGPIYQRGLAYLGAEEATEFQRVQAHRTVSSAAAVTCSIRRITSSSPWH